MSITRKAFKAWLADKCSQQVVGTQRNSLSCPIATFCAQELAYHDTVVTPEFVRWHDASGSLRHAKLPAWATRFVNNIDNWQPSSTLQAQRTDLGTYIITAETATSVLDKKGT